MFILLSRDPQKIIQEKLDLLQRKTRSWVKSGTWKARRKSYDEELIKLAEKRDKIKLGSVRRKRKNRK